MKLLGYKGTSKGIAGLADVLIRYRLQGKYSHTEIMFEKGDGVEFLMPNSTLELYSENQRWCASSSGIDKIPKNSKLRPSQRGGVRFKMIDIDPLKWDMIDLNYDPMKAAMLFKTMEGFPYDYRLIGSYMSWLIRENPQALTCSEVCAMACGLGDPWRYDPCSLMEIVKHSQKAQHA
jgi:hypothetical protein